MYVGERGAGGEGEYLLLFAEWGIDIDKFGLARLFLLLSLFVLLSGPCARLLLLLLLLSARKYPFDGALYMCTVCIVYVCVVCAWCVSVYV